MNQSIINFAYWITRIFMGLAIFGMLLVSGMLIYWHISPGYFDSWYLINPFKADSATLNLRFHMPEFDSGIRLNDINRSNIYWLYARSLFSGVLMFWGLLMVNRIIDSVRHQNAFYKQNKAYFKKLGLIGFLYALLVSFNFGTIDGETIFYLNFPFLQIVFAVGCYVLAVVIEEGMRLHEDSTSII